jgi:ElaA protein
MTSATFTIAVRPFDQLSAREIYEILSLRARVFVVGQKITAVADPDGCDPQCEHLMLREDGRLVGTARVFAAERPRPRMVGRVAVDTDYQRRGLGTRLMLAVQQHLGPHPGVMHAQQYLEPWYHRLGWRREGGVFMEAGIPHVTMHWTPPAA